MGLHDTTLIIEGSIPKKKELAFLTFVIFEKHQNIGTQFVRKIVSISLPTQTLTRIQFSVKKGGKNDTL